MGKRKFKIGDWVQYVSGDSVYIFRVKGFDLRWECYIADDYIFDNEIEMPTSRHNEWDFNWEHEYTKYENKLLRILFGVDDA